MNIKKILKEPFYNDIYRENRLYNIIEEAGFFFDTNDMPINWEKECNILCTPINFLQSDYTDKQKCVIISTGAFSPLHQGHIDMMKAARKILSTNYNVLGGYLSPGHDEYIKEKNGPDWIPIHSRLDYANKLIKEYDWLAMDPWEGVFAPGAVNFTSVVYRLSLYLQKHYKENVKIFFVCGADNARFSLAFKNKTNFGTVIVKRPKYNHNIEKYVELDNVYVAELDNDESSTKIRANGFKIKPKPKQLYLRMNWNNLEKNVKTVLSKYFDLVWVKEIKQQLQDWKTSHNTIFENKIINLDIESDFGHKLNVSRLYDFFGQKSDGYINRPSFDTIEKQLDTFKPGEYYLFDDDICTGNTMNVFERELNRKNIKILGKLSYTVSNDNIEILDSQDFIFGSSYGLVVKYKGEAIRVPYIYPFVCPTTRASINDPLQLSIDMWELNMNHWCCEETTIEQSNLLFLTNLGFKPNTKMYDVCKYYYMYLTNIKKYYYKNK